MAKLPYVLTILVFSAFAAVGVTHCRVLDSSVHPVTITPPPPMTAGSSQPATLVVDNPGASDTTISLASSDTSQLVVPDSVTVPAGQTQVTFTVTATASASTSAAVAASANGATAGNTVEFQP